MSTQHLASKILRFQNQSSDLIPFYKFCLVLQFSSYWKTVIRKCLGPNDSDKNGNLMFNQEISIIVKYRNIIEIFLACKKKTDGDHIMHVWNVNNDWQENSRIFHYVIFIPSFSSRKKYLSDLRK